MPALAVSARMACRLPHEVSARPVRLLRSSNMGIAKRFSNRSTDHPQILDDTPFTVLDRSPQQSRESSLGQSTSIIEISDDDIAPTQSASAPRSEATDRNPIKDIISLSSDSDADSSGTDLILVPRLSNKRSRTTASSSGNSPHATTRANGKRRANSIDVRAIATAMPLPFHPDLQVRHTQQAQNGAFPAPSAIQPGSSNLDQHKTMPAKKKEAEEPPYYVDGRLEIRMYCGPGYERFPIALGTIEGHQELCDKWDADIQVRTKRRLAKLQRAQYTIYTVDDDDSDAEAEKIAAFEKECIDNVVEFFPDMERAFIQKKLRDVPQQFHRFENKDQDVIVLGPPPLAQYIISQLVELSSYPKERPGASMVNGKVDTATDGTGNTVTWDRTQAKDEMYLKDGTILVAKHFPHVPTIFVDNLVREKNSIFETYKTVHDLEEQYYTLQPKPYPRRKQARVELEKKYTSKVTERRIPTEYANRVNEIQAAKQYVAREGIKEAAKTAKNKAEAANLAEHIKSGAIVECECCFDDETPLNRVVPCTAEVPHYFCFVCVEGLADNQVGLMRYEMNCMGADGGCSAALSHEDVGRAIPITTFDRLELNEQQAVILAANIEGLEQCPSCEYRAICDDIDAEPIFYCQNPECSRASCRRCKKDNHAPKTCIEASADKILSARHMVEEARSNATIRKCPKCKAQILKIEGCNKMACTRCHTYFCYVCKADLTSYGENPYSHFSPTTCALYVYQGVNQHEQEADDAEKEAIAKAKELDADINEADLQIETGTNKRAEKQRSRRMANLLDHPAGGVFMRDLNNRAARADYQQFRLQRLQAQVNHLEQVQDLNNAALAGFGQPIDRFGNALAPPQIGHQQPQLLTNPQGFVQAAQRHGPHFPPPMRNGARIARYGNPADNMRAIMNTMPPFVAPPAGPAVPPGAFPGPIPQDAQWYGYVNGPGAGAYPGARLNELLRNDQNVAANIGYGPGGPVQVAPADPILYYPGLAGAAGRIANVRDQMDDAQRQDAARVRAQRQAMQAALPVTGAAVNATGMPQLAGSAIAIQVPEALTEMDELFAVGRFRYLGNADGADPYPPPPPYDH